jgi:hypothetical protein
MNDNDKIHPGLRPQPPKRRMQWWGYAVLGVAGLWGLGQMLPDQTPTPAPSAPTATAPAAPVKPASPCKTDWSKCADNADIANNFEGYSSAGRACRRQAEDMAKFGTPEWPWFAFGSFYPGPITGIVTLIEPDAKFQNGFGAMARSRVVCKYDLRSKTVIDVTVSTR